MWGAARRAPLKFRLARRPGCSLACCAQRGGTGKKEIIKVTNFRSICSATGMRPSYGVCSGERGERRCNISFRRNHADPRATGVFSIRRMRQYPSIFPDFTNFEYSKSSTDMCTKNVHQHLTRNILRIKPRKREETNGASMGTAPDVKKGKGPEPCIDK